MLSSFGVLVTIVGAAAGTGSFEGNFAGKTDVVSSLGRFLVLEQSKSGIVTTMNPTQPDRARIASDCIRRTHKLNKAVSKILGNLKIVRNEIWGML
jgi:hypothetical protein